MNNAIKSFITRNRMGFLAVSVMLGAIAHAIFSWQASAQDWSGYSIRALKPDDGVKGPSRILAPLAVIAVQDFESPAGTPQWTIAAGAANISTATGSGDTPANQRIRGGSRSWQVNNGTATLDLNPFNVTGATSVTVQVHISSTSANGTDGADDTDTIKIFAALNGAGFGATPEFTLAGTSAGNSNARWSYNNAINNSVAAGSSSSFNGTTGTDQGTIHSTLQITIPNGTSTVALRVTALNNNANEIWNVDDITLAGTPPALPADGDLDVTFGPVDPSVAAGTSRFFFGADSAASEDVVESLGIQNVGANAGKIIAAGSRQITASNIDEAVVRLTANGIVDTTFASGAGMLTTNYANDNRGADVAIDPTNDKIVVVGSATFPNGALPCNNVNNDITVSMYTADGVLDSSFDGDGKKTINFYDCNDSAKAVVIQPDHKIVIVGEALKQVMASFETYFTITRLNPDGSVDPTFNDGNIGNTTGTVQILTSPTVLGTGADMMQITSGPQTGKFIVVGVGNNGSDAMIARFKSNGGLDDDPGTGFGASDTGFLTIDFTPGAIDNFKSVELQPDGKILAAGVAGFFSSPQDMAVARTSEDGVLDSTFDGDGKVTIDFLAALSGASASADTGKRIDVAFDGRIIVSGSAAGDNAPNPNVAVARLNSNGSLDNTFSGDGKVATRLPGVGPNSPSPTTGGLQSDGKILVAGSIAASGSLDMFVARFLNNIPTAAGVTVSGRVMVPSGRGLVNAKVTITGPGGITRGAITTAQGYYSFEDVEAGSSYIVSVKSRLYSYAPQFIVVNDNLTGVDFRPF